MLAYCEIVVPLGVDLPFNDYHFVTNWRVLGTIDEVYAVISDAPGLQRWWPSAFAEVLEIQPGNENGIEKVVRYETMGWLPYHLHWHTTTTWADPPNGFRLRVWGDFNGTGEWSLVQDGAWTDITYDWQISVAKPLVRYLSPLLKPLFASNHRWAMRRGEESLRLELARRQAATDSERSALGPPPAAVQYPALPLVVGLGALTAFAVWRLRRGR
jgi:hypothetical protein